MRISHADSTGVHPVVHVDLDVGVVRFVGVWGDATPLQADTPHPGNVEKVVVQGWQKNGRHSRYVDRPVHIATSPTGEVRVFRHREDAASFAGRKPVIVSRHPGAVAWIRSTVPELSEARVLETASEEDVRDVEVYGNVPLRLAAKASKVYVIEFDGEPPRGAEYDVAEMVAAGARLVPYRVERC